MSVLSEKFEKELLTFMFWISNTEYKISKNDIEVEWSIGLIDNFEEPGRNKLECYIKQLMKEYFISFKNKEIDGIKFITKKFRENKPKMSKKVIEKNKKYQKSKNGNIESATENKDENKKKMMINVCELDYSTMFLVNILGMPTLVKDDYIQYKWNIKDKFIIYNWLNENGIFENNKWNLALASQNSMDSQNFDLVKKEFYEYISENNINENTLTDSNKNLLICDCCDEKHDSYDMLRNHLIQSTQINLRTAIVAIGVEVSAAVHQVTTVEVTDNEVMKLDETTINETTINETTINETTINEYKNLKIDLDDIEF